jgi:hypothetical protein
MGGNMTPLDLLLGVMRGTLKATPMQIRAAEIALPYMHAPLAPAQLKKSGVPALAARESANQ